MIEVLKQALEALEANDQLINGTGTKGGLVYCMDGYYSDCFDVDPINKQTEEAITAIKEALAKEKTLQALHSENKRLGLYKDAYAQQEQKPVAWWVTNPDGEIDWCDKPIQYKEQRPLEELIDGCGYAPLYTTPPQRTWVGLAAEDRLTAKYMQDAPDGIEAVIDYIEAKLKELNDHSI
jgi:hypothetical protein